LLAKPDTVRITIPPLPKETMQRVLDLIRRDVAEDKVRIDTPTQNLESYFLGVVERARESAETSGATSGSRVAAYLRGDAEGATAAPNKILERLAAPAPPPMPAKESAAAAPAIDQARLDALSRATPLAPASPQPAVEKPADLAKANEKLSSLVGKPK
jgi:hypothetical protein